ncbi:glycosyltransferase family 2 protein [Parabacteroides sp. AF17-3]|uniref:glycosyltransferase family 2 protein n=1 Tax=Parabacteroides sp. AF17-3 TaxID=2293113 RepID=UPI000EFE55A4|nr:glycosyltransferase family 2 protein [Parabacteroides sp. AF17-3]RKU65860.1 glycosyltransferase family 2 protein [Parabacteroides sp. AF17-3]
MLVYCVLVSYSPEIGIFTETICKLCTQTDKVIIVDNSTRGFNFLTTNFDNVVMIRNNQNLGIAKAQNIGIKYALSQGADFVLFMDQDSLAPDNLVESLMTCYEQKSKLELVGAVGPMPYNRENDKVYYTQNVNSSQDKIVKVGTLISSGSLIPKDILVQVGGMDESLFIDMVDLEWCWRAVYKTNCSFYIDTHCFLSHSLGKKEVQFGGKRIPLHSPMRMYYRFRNYFLLVNKKYIPFSWKFRFPVSNIIRLFLCLCYFPEKRSYLNNSYKGFKDGLRYLFHK